MSFFRVCVTLSLLLSPMPCSARHQSSELPARINEIMQARSAVGDFSGVALVARRGRILYQHAFGLANREWNVANDLDTRFEIGSMTKQFTAMLILQMVNAGEIRLDGRLSDYLPYYRQDTGNQITISELLSHTSGVPSFTSLRDCWTGRKAVLTAACRNS
jgi:CubicO group peptidase (beta-lactamase class C family)